MNLNSTSLWAKFTRGIFLIYLPLLLTTLGSFIMFTNADSEYDLLSERVQLELKLINTLDKNLIRVPYPVYEYLKTGQPRDRERFEVLASELATDFHAIRDSKAVSSNVRLSVRTAEQIWHQARDRSRDILQQKVATTEKLRAKRIAIIREFFLQASGQLRLTLAEVERDIVIRQRQLREYHKQAITYSILMMLAGLFVSIYVSVRLVRSITMPIMSIRKAVMEFYRGNMDYRVEVSENDEIGELGTSFNDLFGRVSEQQKKLQHQASIDDLTNINNRREFDYQFKLAIEYARQSGTGVSLLLIDIDYFKKINDNYGHQAGDAVLQEIAACICELVRPNDIVARIGGEEFAVIATSQNSEGTLKCSNRIREGIEAMEINYASVTIKITVSIGVASYSQDGEHEASIFAVADKRLYMAKDNGRNCACSEG